MKICFIDTETTGLNPEKDRIWQISGCVRENGKILTTFDIINKKSEKDLYYKFKDVLNKSVNRFKKEDKMFFVAYNAKFDNDFIRAMFERNEDKFFGSYFFTPYICLMNMTARYFMKNSRKIRPDNFKLGSVCRYFKIRVNDNKLHDGLYDIELGRKLYNKLTKLGV